jgi:hypothetical protein
MGVVKPENSCVIFVGHEDEVFLRMVVGVIAL